jgi:hypothetical protein
MPDDLGALLDQIERWHHGVPVRLMEEVLALGDTVLPTIQARLPHEDDEEREPLWYLALLAELRSPAAIPFLVDRLDSMDDLILRIVAAEALAKVGPAAIPALREVVASGREETRLLAYGALGWIADDAAHDILRDALQRDAPLVHVVANALMQRAGPEIVPVLYDAYQRCQPWQRADIADVIHALHWKVQFDTEPVHGDWRLRYFTTGDVIGINVGWLGVSSILSDDKEHRATAEAPPLRALAEIIGETADDPHEPEYCSDCGGLVERPTGVPVCPENAVDVVRLQLAFLQEEREAGLDDLFEELNEIDMERWELAQTPKPRSAKKQAARQEHEDYLAFLKDTCTWGIGQGAEAVGPARARLLAEIGRLVDRYGPGAEPTAKPDPVVRAEPRIGRNDPCGCGSGKKHKHCCLK